MSECRDFPTLPWRSRAVRLPEASSDWTSRRSQRAPGQMPAPLRVWKSGALASDVTASRGSLAVCLTREMPVSIPNRPGWIRS